MTPREYKTIRAGRNTIDAYRSDGYRFLERFPEPNNSYSVTLKHPRTLRTLIVTVQPRWGLVLVKENKRVLDVQTIY